jgi:aminoglycoside phosphotransferase (APT) family kinase protein
LSDRKSDTPQPGRYGLDEEALERWLRAHVDGVEASITVQRIKGGQSNPTYRVSAGEADYIVRKKPPGKLLPTAHAIEREYRILKALDGTDVPVPAVRHLCEDPQVIGTPFYVMDFVPGRTFRNPLLPDLSVAERTAVYDSMNDVLARLHGVDWSAVGLDDFGRVGGYFERQISRWTKQYNASKTRDLPAMERLLEWLPRNIPDGDETTIAHGDYRLENLLIHPEEPRVVALLDWELSTLGHPMADVAFNCMTYYLHCDSQIAPGFIGADLEKLGIPTEAAYVASYCRRTGRESAANWPFYVAFSLFRIAAIQQGVYARALAGSAGSEEALKFGPLSEFVAEQGWRQVEKMA